MACDWSENQLYMRSCHELNQYVCLTCVSHLCVSHLCVSHLCVSHLCVPAAINRADIQDTDMEAIMDTIVDSLFCFFVTLGESV